MYKATRDFEVDAAPEVVLDVMWDFAAYPDFFTGVNKVELLSHDAGRASIRVSAGFAGLEFSYVLACQRKDAAVSWRRTSGAFRDARGSLTHVDGNRFRYEQALDPGFAVPEFAVRLVLERSLPRFLRELRRRAGAVVQAQSSDGSADPA